MALELSFLFLLSLTQGYILDKVHGEDMGTTPSVDCQSQLYASYPFCNFNMSPEDRASDLVSRLTVEEMVAQTSSIAPAISRLGIKDYNWRSNCLHGWSKSGGHWTSDLKWTVFPAPIGLGATFNVDLVTQVGVVTANEGRALHNIMLANNNGSSTEAAGLNCFSPNVNLVRDPRWGRLQETFSEDPYHLSVQGVGYSIGLLGNDPKYFKVAACAKHYVVHSGPDNIRSQFVANATLHDFYDTYVEAFKSQVYAAGTPQIMPAYSAVNYSGGAPDAANKFILIDVLRKQFEAPNISVISDNGGVAQVYLTHHYVKTAEEAAAVCMNATTDLDLGHDDIYSDNLLKTLTDGLVAKDTIAASVWRSFYLRIRLGDFDPIDKVSYQKYDSSYLNTKDNHQLNLNAAQQSIVLLKNKDSELPFNVNNMAKGQLFAIIGPNAEATNTLLSNYEGIPDHIVSIADGITAQLSSTGVNTTIVAGCSSTKCPDKSGFQSAIDAAKKADYVVMVMGLDGSLEGEGHDRTAHPCEGDVEPDVLALPGCQGALVDAIAEVNSHVILVLVNGGPLSLGSIYSNDNVPAVVEVFYPGAEGGTAVGNVLFGDYNPAGRMPVTTYTSSKEVPDPTDYTMNTPPGRTYRYYTNVPEVPFGFGLSYTTFEYSSLSLSHTSISQCDKINVMIMIQNTGTRPGDEVIQVYLSPPTIEGKPFFPKIQLVGYSRTNLKLSDKQEVTFEVNSYMMSIVDEDGDRYIFPGKYTISVGGALPGKTTGVGEIKALTTSFTIEGSGPMKLTSCSNAPKCFACS